MKNKNIFALLIVAIFLSGCQSIPPVDFSVQDVGMVDHRKNAELKSLTVGFAPQVQQKRYKQMLQSHQFGKTAYKTLLIAP